MDANGPAHGTDGPPADGAGTGPGTRTGPGARRGTGTGAAPGTPARIPTDRSRTPADRIAADRAAADRAAGGTSTVEAFLRDGFVKVEAAFDARTAAECAGLLWRETGCDPDDPATWTDPVRWVGGMAQPPFVAAANTPALHAAFDVLVGPGRWAPRTGLGSFPLRFPHDGEPDDAGWHVDGSYRPDGGTWPWVNVRSRDRALLMLFLFTDVTEDNAPTRIRVGSHLDVPPLLAPYGEAGASILRLAPATVAATEHRPVALATGRAGDVFLCHPFLVHAAQPNHGTAPRFLAQPPLYPAEQLRLDRPDGAYSPVEAAIRRGLGDTPIG